MTSSMSDGIPVNPTTTVKPTLKTIFRYGYLLAFNAHDVDTLMSYISPNIKVSRFFSLLSPRKVSLRGSRDTHCTLVSVTRGGPTRRQVCKSSQTWHRHDTLQIQRSILTAESILSERAYYLCWIYPLVEFLVKNATATLLVWPNTHTPLLNTIGHVGWVT